MPAAANIRAESLEVTGPIGIACDPTTGENAHMEQDGLSMDQRVGRSGNWILRVVLIVLLVGAVTASVLLYPSFDRWASTDRSIELDRLRLGTVTRGELLRDVSVQGRIVAADHPTVVSPAQGVLTLLVKAGDKVRRDMALARIDSPELQNSLEQERATQESLEAEVERLQIANRQTELQNQQAIDLLEVKLRADQRSMERAKALYEEGLGNSMDYEKAVDDLEVTGLELANARENAKLAKETMQFDARTKELTLNRQRLIVEDLERKVNRLAVVSPVDGLVSRVEIRDKDTVQPNQALISVVDLSRFEVEIQVPENYGGEIGIGTPAAILYEGSEYPGDVKSLSPEVENSQFKGVVEFAENPPGSLKQNQRVSTRLILDSRPNVIKAPRGPYLESMGGRQAYVVSNGIAEVRPITVGAVSVTEVEVTSGLQEGERIVLSDMTRFNGAERILLR